MKYNQFVLHMKYLMTLEGNVYNIKYPVIVTLCVKVLYKSISSLCYGKFKNDC